MNTPNLHEGQGEPNPYYAAWASLADSEDYPNPPEEYLTPPAEPEPLDGSKLMQVSEAMGSNYGGWFENQEGERFYVKIYENPDQGRVEYVANAIYKKLGIKAVQSEIIKVRGQEAVASREIPDAFDSSVEEQRESADVREGFVADAYLANWDVVGLFHDNIMMNDDGFYRIDNGGSLIFRARGGDKDYSPDSIPELETMRDPKNTSGEVFYDLPRAEIKKQAQDLVKKLSPEDIRQIVDESGLEGEARERVLAGLLGRREVLEQMYGDKSPAERLLRNAKIRESIQKLASNELERSANGVIRPKTEIVCDHDHIEDQKIDVVKKTDQGTIEFRFKLKSGFQEVDMISKKYDGEKTLSGAEVQRARMVYSSASAESVQTLCDAVTFERSTAKISVADPYSRNDEKHSEALARSAMGLVSVEMPADTDPEEMANILSDVLEDDLGVPNALGEVSQSGERMYKQARYAWQHKISGRLTPEQQAAAEKLQRKEVCPGYTTYVEEGKHQEYLEKYGDDVRAIHVTHKTSPDFISSILTQGLMSTSERFSRGLLYSGMSSERDLDTGGADSVFTRVAYPNSRREYPGAVIVFKPELFNRTDWYTYNADRFGSTSEDCFKNRLTPDQLFTKVLDPTVRSGTNEQMFRTGIGPEYIECIEVSDKIRGDLIRGLKMYGLTEFNGQPIEDIIRARSTEPIEDTYTKANHALIAENQTKIQALIDGDLPYESPYQLFDLTIGMEHPYDEMISMVSALIDMNGTEKLSADMADYLKSQLGYSGLEYLKDRNTPIGFSDQDVKMYEFIALALDLDFNKLYEEAYEDFMEYKKSELQDVLDGDYTPPNIGFVFDMAEVLKDDSVALQIVEAAVSHGTDEYIANGAFSHFVYDVGATDLEYLKKGETPLGWTDDKAKIFLDIANLLHVDLEDAHAKAVEHAQKYPNNEDLVFDEYDSDDDLDFDDYDDDYDDVDEEDYNDEYDEYDIFTDEDEAPRNDIKFDGEENSL